MRIIFFVIFPCFIIWVLGFPILTFLILYKKRDELDERENVITLGLFYIGLEDRTFYWEVVVNNLRKITVAAISVSFSDEKADQ